MNNITAFKNWLFYPFSLLLSGFALLSGCSAGIQEKSNKEMPNVLLIMTDQHRADFLGTYGDETVKTPNIDQLAGTGAKFNNCFTQMPSCSPVPVIFTGRYPRANGVWSNGVPLPKDELTLAQFLLENGYETGGFG
jgi:arylsulfatase A-like enzyme